MRPLKKSNGFYRAASRSVCHSQNGDSSSGRLSILASRYSIHIYALWSAVRLGRRSTHCEGRLPIA